MEGAVEIFGQLANGIRFPWEKAFHAEKVG